ncbi:MAG: Rrf2 family transcriptional regulator [Pseudomonadota bacterium]
MQLTLYTDYSLRVLIYLAAQPDTRATIAAIAEYHEISRNHLMKVVHHLAVAGFVISQRGKNGGLYLARPAHQISIGDVVRQTEPNFTLVECFDATASTCRLTRNCALKHLLYRATADFIKTLDAHTLADVSPTAGGVRVALPVTVPPPQPISHKPRSTKKT